MWIYLWALHYAMACMNYFCKDFRLVLSHLSAHLDTFYVFLTGLRPVLLTLGCTLKVIPPRRYRGWVNGTPPSVFDMLQYFETILPSVESLQSSLQYEVYFVGGGAAGGL